MCCVRLCPSITSKSSFPTRPFVPLGPGQFKSPQMMYRGPREPLSIRSESSVTKSVSFVLRRSIDHGDCQPDGTVYDFHE